MNPIEAWVDREELRRIAAALLPKANPNQPPPNDGTYGEEFIGYAVESEVSFPEPPQEGPPATNLVFKNGRNALASAREIAQRGGLLGTPTPDSAPIPDSPHPPSSLTPAASASAQPEPSAPSTMAPTPFVARLQAFGTWLREGVQARAFFVIDREGGVLIDEVQTPKLLQVARTLAQASRTANRQAGATAIGNLPVNLSPEAVLEVIPLQSQYGPLTLGVILPQVLSPSTVEKVVQGLRQVIDGQVARD